MRSVTVTLAGADGATLESGMAVSTGDGSRWVYMATINAPTVPVRVLAMAADLPGGTRQLAADCTVA